MINLVQSAVFPSLFLCSKKELYFFSNSLVDISLKYNSIYLKNNGKVSTNTYFNSLSIGKWKKYTNIKFLKFNIKFKGDIKIIWHLSSLEFGNKILQEDYLKSVNVDDHIVELPFWDELSPIGMLYFEVIAFSDTNIDSFYYCTDDMPLRDIKLGIVITHFNRQSYVKKAVSRINESLLSNPIYKDKIDLFIVDNSSNLDKLDGAIIIPNRNLGGSGGFTRGLINLIGLNKYTHCLFMDDDASCEVESIRRAISFIENSVDLISISGAMLREVKPYEQYENGARYNGYCIRLKKDLNLLLERNLLFNEKEEIIDYAAWWFFIFPIYQVKNFSFPYFVRGDDISFCLSNNFNIITLNGICSWQPDFSTKNNPVNFYLDVRSTLMPLLNGLTQGNNLSKMVFILLILFARNVLTYHYDSAKAILLSLKDIQLGPKYWKENVDMVDKRKQIQKFIENEKFIDMSQNQEAIPKSNLVMANNSYNSNKKMPIIKRLYYLLSLNGHLIPTFLFKKGISYQYLYKGLGFIETYRYKEAICIDDKTGKYMLLKHSKSRFFKYSFLYIKEIIVFLIKYKSLKKIYTKEFKNLTSKDFWVEQFNHVNK